jgi:hypothetical protein
MMTSKTEKTQTAARKYFVAAIPEVLDRQALESQIVRYASAGRRLDLVAAEWDVELWAVEAVAARLVG